MQSSLNMVFSLLVFIVGLHNYQVNCATSTEIDEDSSRENGVEDPEPYTAHRANEMSIQNRLRNQPEKPLFTNIRNPSNPLVEVTQLTYRGSKIRIFTDSEKRNPPRFFYDVMAQVDPNSISVVPNYLRNNVVTFTIAMWNRELHSKVLASVRSLPNLSKVTEQSIHVMPFSNVVLGHKPGSSNHSSMALLDATKSYTHREDNLKFYLLCNTSETANLFIEHFRCNPGLEVNSLHLVLEGYGLDFGNDLGKGQHYSYNVIVESCASSSTRIVEHCTKISENTANCKNCLTQLAELEGKMRTLENLVKELEDSVKVKNQGVDDNIRTIKTDLQEKTRELDGKFNKIEVEVQGNYQKLDEKLNKMDEDIQENHQELDQKNNKIEKDIQRKHKELDEKINRIENDQTELNKKIFKIETAVGEERKSYAFIAQRSSDFTSPNSFVTYTSVHFSEIGTFDRHSGFFTAPVNGVYFFSFNGLKMSSDRSSSYKLLVQLIKIPNGQHDQQLLAGAIVNENWDRDAYNTVSMQATVLLEKGDRVAVKLMQGWLHEPSAPHGSHMTTFTGFLVKTQI